MHSLAEIINFNLDHPELCLPPSTSLQPTKLPPLTNIPQPAPTKTT